VSCGPFAGPNFWGPGQELRILLGTDARYPDNAGTRLFACARPCGPFFRDAGPFSFGGPFPGTTLGGGGTQGGGAQPQNFLEWNTGGAWNRDAMMSYLLPYIEQAPAFQSRGRSWAPPSGGRPTIVKTYACPSRPSSATDFNNPWDLGQSGSGAWTDSWGTGSGQVNVLFGDGSVRPVTPGCTWASYFDALATPGRGGPFAFDSRADAAQRRRGRRLRLGVARVAVPAGETRVVGTRLKAKALRILRRQRVRRLRVAVRYTISSPVGDRITAKRTFRVKLRRRARGG
jgi:prepilin-type processing-associated H-X9-DG protein